MEDWKIEDYKEGAKASGIQMYFPQERISALSEEKCQSHTSEVTSLCTSSLILILALGFDEYCQVDERQKEEISWFLNSLT